MAVLDHSRLQDARAQTLALVEGVSHDDMERVHSPLMSPLVWDLGHIAMFEDLWLAHRLGGLPLLRADLLDVYDAFETPRSRRGELPYLRQAQARSFMTAVRERVDGLGLDEGDPLVSMVARHERQHAETMLQTIALAGLRVSGSSEHNHRVELECFATGLDMLEVGGAVFAFGAADTGDFAYDNEKPQRQVEIETFALGRVPVTNGDWLSFIEDGGYRRRDWWTAEGWEWRCTEAAERPLGWLDHGRERRLTGTGELVLSSPVVHISCHEAEAFVRAHGLRLPSEAEWELAATFDHASGEKRAWPWGDQPPTPAHANLIESANFAPLAGAPAAGASPCGALAMIGDVWEWTASEFAGYPGFRAHPYPEYSEVFFDGRHRVLRGGSFATSALVATPTFRNWDFPSRRQIFSGLRVAADR